MDNFYETSKRCRKSSETLINNKEYFNSCYLGGYVLECYIKLLCQAGYHPRDKKFFLNLGHDVRKFKKEVEFIYQNLSDFADLKGAYLLDLRTQCPTMISGVQKWNPFNRYDDSGKWDDPITSADYQRESGILMNKISSMKLDGVI